MTYYGSGMKLFNLDELVTKKRSVRLFGCEYVIAERTVGQMISALKMVESEGSDEPEIILEQLIETAQNILPDCPREHIERLNMKQIQALIQFASESDEMTEESAQEENEIEGKLEE